MALQEPDPSIRCRSTSSGLVRLSGVLDDIGWWRDNVHRGDSVEVIVGRIPDDSVPHGDRQAVLDDLRELDDFVKASLHEAMYFIAERSPAVTVKWHPIKRPGGEVSATHAVDGSVLDVGVHCVDDAS